MGGWYEQIIAQFGHGLCHQLPERSFVAAGIQFPVCSRCTGIYIGFVFVVATLLWFYRGRHPRGGATAQFYVLVALGVAAMAWDGLTSYSGIRATSNLLRLVTGTLFGGSLGLVTYAMMVDLLLANVTADRILATWRTVALWVSAVAAAVLTVYVVLPQLGPLAPALVVLAVVGTFAAVGAAAVGQADRYRRSVAGWPSAARAAGVGAAVGVAAILVSKLLQAGLDRLVQVLLS